MNLPLRIGLLAAFQAGLCVSPVHSQTHYLSDHGGRKIQHPRINIIYWHDNWDSVHSDPQFKRANIEAWLKSWLASDYFLAAIQYSVHAGHVASSNQSSVLVGDLTTPGTFMDVVGIHEWWTGEVEIPGTGVPYPCDDDDVYLILMPKETTIGIGSQTTCDKFSAYHLFGPIGVPPLVCGITDGGGIKLSPYCVIPVQCATRSDPSGFYTDFDGLTRLISHEIIEACTDPIDTFLTSVPIVGDIFGLILGIIGDLPGYYDGTVDDLFRKSEAADIPEFSPFQPEVWHNNSIVSAYWSNNDGAPSGGPGVVRRLTLGQNGIPYGTVVPVTLDTRTANIGNTSFQIQVAENATHSYAFPNPVSGGPFVQYVTSEPPATITISGDFTKFADYTTQYLLSVSTSPIAAATGNASLTPSGFYDKGSITIHADQDVVTGTGTRYDFQSWGGDISASTPDYTFNLTGPTAAVANYQLQHFVTVNTSGLGTNITHLFDNGTQIGTASDGSPFSEWLPDGTFALTADDVVDGANGISYLFQQFSPVPPATLTTSFTTTAYYQTMDQIIGGLIGSGGIYGPGSDGIVKALKNQWAAITASLAAGKYAVALNQIKAFINFIQAQAGVHITTAASQTLQLDALLVVHSTLCNAKSAGQLTPAQATTEYGYYASSVTALGRTPKPACP